MSPRRLDSGLQNIQTADSTCSRTPVACDCCWLSTWTSPGVSLAPQLLASGFSFPAEKPNAFSAFLTQRLCKYDCVVIMAGFRYVSNDSSTFLLPHDTVLQTNYRRAKHNYSRRYDSHPLIDTSSQPDKSSSFGYKRIFHFVSFAKKTADSLVFASPDWVVWSIFHPSNFFLLWHQPFHCLWRPPVIIYLWCPLIQRLTY